MFSPPHTYLHNTCLSLSVLKATDISFLLLLKKEPRAGQGGRSPDERGAVDRGDTIGGGGGDGAAGTGGGGGAGRREMVEAEDSSQFVKTETLILKAFLGSALEAEVVSLW